MIFILAAVDVEEKESKIDNCELRISVWITITLNNGRVSSSFIYVNE